MFVRLLLRAAREDVGIEEEDESGELGKVRSYAYILFCQLGKVSSNFF